MKIFFTKIGPPETPENFHERQFAREALQLRTIRNAINGAFWNGVVCGVILSALLMVLSNIVAMVLR